MRNCLSSLVALTTLSLLAGCGVSPSDIAAPVPAHVALQGTVFGGQQPVSGAHIYLLAANTTGYGNASLDLLNNTSLSSDSLGHYVSSGADGSFSIAGDFTACASGSTTQAYLYALGGNPGAGSNSASGLLAALGNCSNITSATHVAINEVSTVAAAYAMAGYAVDATHVSSSGTALAQTGIANAFATASNLVGLTSGAALTTTPGGNGKVPYQTIYTLSNILAACINSADSVSGPTVTHSAACGTLLSTATSDGTSTGTQPTDTATAMINIAHHPTANVHPLYILPTGTPPYSSDLQTQPSDFTLSVVYSGTGFGAVDHLAVDGSGNIWAADEINNDVLKLSPLGAYVSSSTGYTDASLSGPEAPVIDTAGDCYVLSNGTTVTEFSPSGSKLATVTLNGAGQFMAFDPSGNLWATSSNNAIGNNNGVLAEISGGAVTHTYNIGLNPTALASDASGTLWIADISGGNPLLKVSNGTVASTYNLSFGSASPVDVALDATSNVWELASSANNQNLSAVTSAGSLLTNAPYPDNNGGETMLFDGSGKLFTLASVIQTSPTFDWQTTVTEWVPSSGTLTSAASLVSTAPITSEVTDMVADGSGNLWLAGGTQVTEIIGIASPVVTPVVANLKSPYTHPASLP